MSQSIENDFWHMDQWFYDLLLDALQIFLTFQNTIYLE